MAGKGYLGKFRKGLWAHFVDATAMLAESTPVLAAFETGIAGMSVQVSLNARLIAAVLTYIGGTGFLYSRGRDLSRKLLRIHDRTKESRHHFHDSVYLGAFNLVIAPLLYVVSGARDANEIGLGTATAVAFGLLNGGLMGFALDVYRDLADLKECHRASYPRLLKTQNRTFKKVVLVLLTLISVVATGCIYSLKRIGDSLGW